MVVVLDGKGVVLLDEFRVLTDLVNCRLVVVGDVLRAVEVPQKDDLEGLAVVKAVGNIGGVDESVVVVVDVSDGEGGAGQRADGIE